MSTKFWNDRYSASTYSYGENPNAFLQGVLPKQGLGKRLLFVAEGEGRNAVYAATLGYAVEAFDLSEAGKKKAEQLAKSKQVELNYQVCSVADWQVTGELYDGIILIYAHFPLENRRAYHQHLAQAVKPGGFLILEAFSPQQLEQRVKGSLGGPGDPTMLYALEEVQADFPSFHFTQAEEVLVELEEGDFHRGIGAVVRLFGQKQ